MKTQPEPCAEALEFARKLINNNAERGYPNVHLPTDTLALIVTMAEKQMKPTPATLDDASHTLEPVIEKYAVKFYEKDLSVASAIKQACLEYAASKAEAEYPQIIKLLNEGMATLAVSLKEEGAMLDFLTEDRLHDLSDYVFLTSRNPTCFDIRKEITKFMADATLPEKAVQSAMKGAK